MSTAITAAVVRVSDVLVEYVDEDSEEWTLHPYLYCTGLIRGVAPTVSVATLVWQFGHISTPGATNVYTEPLDLRGKFVCVQYEVPGIPSGTETKTWYGFVPDEQRQDWPEETTEVEATQPSGGDQVFEASGLEWFLAGAQVIGLSSKQAELQIRPRTYNSGAGGGNREISLARRANRLAIDEEAEDPYAELKFDYTADAIEWDAAAIVKHLLREHGPRDKDDDYKPIEFVLDEDAIGFLSWYQPTVDNIERSTLAAVLDQVIDRNRGLVWWVDVGTVNDELKAIVRVNSAFDEEVEIDEDEDIVVPPNAHLHHWPDASVEEPTAEVAKLAELFTAYLEPIQFGRSQATHYDRVRVRGALRTTTFSASTTIGEIAGGTTPIFIAILNGWTSEQEEDYWKGAETLVEDYASLTAKEKAGKNDHVRRGTQFEKVYSHFLVTQGNDPSDDEDGYKLWPTFEGITTTITGSIDWSLYRRRLRLSRTTPMLSGATYEMPQYASPPDPDHGEDFVRPFAALNVPADSDVDQGWRFVDKLSRRVVEVVTLDDEDVEQRFSHQFKTNFAFGVRPSDLGFILEARGGMQHAMAGPIGPPEEYEEPSHYPREYPLLTPGLWLPDIVATMTIELDGYCEAIWPEGDIEASPIRELPVYIDKRARFDWMVRGTVYDIGAEAELLQATTAGAIRDDRKLCQSLAKLAHAWYDSTRAQVTLVSEALLEPWGVGDLLVEVGTNEAAQDVNAVLTQIQHDFTAGRTTLHFSFPELDFTSLA